MLFYQYAWRSGLTRQYSAQGRPVVALCSGAGRGDEEPGDPASETQAALSRRRRIKDVVDLCSTPTVLFTSSQNRESFFVTLA